MTRSPLRQQLSSGTSNRLIRAATFAASLGVFASASAAPPSQLPLLSRVGVPPAPNMMITVDDSGSMLTHYIPEGDTTFNKGTGTEGTVTFPSQYSSSSYYFTDTAYGDPTNDAYSASFKFGVVPSTKVSTSVYQRQMRSASTNRIYYDPNVLYRPWYDSTKTDGSRLPAASLTAAYWDITKKASGTFDLKTTVKNLTQAWCSSATSCVSSKADWNPGLYYVLKTATSNPTLSASYDMYDVNATDGTHAPAAKGAARTDCPAAKCTQPQESQNFANWFQYYRSRILLTKAALSEVVGGNSGTARFGLASINTTGVIKQGVKDFDSSHRLAMLESIQGLTAYGGTPLKSAVQSVGSYFYGGDSYGNPWRTIPTKAASSSNTVLECRRSYNILMTDGYYNGDPSTSVGNQDGSDFKVEHQMDLTDPFPVPPKRYLAAKPYSDDYSNTLADFAMQFYVNDLQKSALNKVVPTATDLAYWQHLSHFTVGLGVVGTLPSATTAQKLDTLDKIKRGVAGYAWPNPGIGGDSLLAPKIDDLWHAAVDTQGDFFLANNSTELTKALNDAVGLAAGANRSEGGITSASKTAGDKTLTFIPSYQSGSWWGDLQAFELVAQSGGTFTLSAAAKWSAADKVPVAASRNILTWTGTAGTLFNTALSDPSKTLIAPVATQDAMINYLRGDTANEGTSSDKFRSRNGKALPDFVNSPPVYVKGLVDLGYTTGGYAAYVAQKKSRANGVVFIGGNGGMLHGFRDTDGVEVMAYVPQSTYGNLKKITTQNYGSTDNFHQFFVDGPLLETDAYIATNKRSTGWANLLIGSLGAGGTGLFALDVTDLTSFNADNVLWEVSASNDADIGYIYSEPVVGKLGDRWVAFFGNGANSAAGKAVLFAIDLESHALSRITLDSAASNGAMGVSLILDATKAVQGAYVGDLRGNLWRVEFAGSTSSAAWSIGFNGKPLYIAMDSNRNRQPITIAPSTVPHYLGGNMVLFGTGRMIETGDPDSKTVQSYYGVWDKTLDGVSSVAATSPAWDDRANQRTDLVEQTIEPKPISGTKPDTGTYFGMSSHPVDWTNQRGWFMDLNLPEANSGQRVIYKSVVLGEFVLVYTIVPGPAPVNCEVTSGTGYNFFMPALTGGAYSKPTIDTNGDGLVDSKDEATVAGFKTSADGTDSFMQNGASADDMVSFSADKTAEYYKKYCIHNGCTRSRVWRQIVNPPQPD